MSKQPEALRLADELLASWPVVPPLHPAATELRRLHALCEESRDVVRGLLSALPSATTHPAIRAARALMEKMENGK